MPSINNTFNLKQKFSGGLQTSTSLFLCFKFQTSNAATEGERKRKMTQGVVEQPIKVNKYTHTNNLFFKKIIISFNKS